MQHHTLQSYKHTIISERTALANEGSNEEPTHSDNYNNLHLAFEKNYPKNIFIPLIEHLEELGLKQEYEACVGTRESFEGRNVVSLAQIHYVLSQNWFQKCINLNGLISNMSNKILMNSKIKKKLFHLLLIKELFTITLQNVREFKKQVSRRANQISKQKFIDDQLFHHSSVLIYLLSLFARGLTGKQTNDEDQCEAKQGYDDQTKKYQLIQQMNVQQKLIQRDHNSKEKCKLYIFKIIKTLNGFHGPEQQLIDIVNHIKIKISQRELNIRLKYGLPHFVPEWSYFSSIVISKCLSSRLNKQKLTYSLLNQWIQKFKQISTGVKGFSMLKPASQLIKEFKPIILIFPI